MTTTCNYHYEDKVFVCADESERTLAKIVVRVHELEGRLNTLPDDVSDFERRQLARWSGDICDLAVSLPPLEPKPEYRATLLYARDILGAVGDILGFDVTEAY